MAYLFPKPLGSTGLLLPSQEPRARRPGLQNVPCTNTQQAGRAKSYRGVCGRVEAGIPTASEAGREPYSSSSSPGKEDTLRIPHQTKQRDSPPPVPAPPLLVSAAPRALRRPGAAARMEEEDEGGGGGGRAATASPAASARFVRCLYAVGFLVSGGPGACGGRPRPGTGSGSSAGQGCRGASLQRPLGTPGLVALVVCSGWALWLLQTATQFDTQVGFLSCECHGIAWHPKSWVLPWCL